jgi:hypothetical protein
MPCGLVVLHADAGGLPRHHGHTQSMHAHGATACMNRSSPWACWQARPRRPRPPASWGHCSAALPRCPTGPARGGPLRPPPPPLLPPWRAAGAGAGAAAAAAAAAAATAAPAAASAGSRLRGRGSMARGKGLEPLRSSAAQHSTEAVADLPDTSPAAARPWRNPFLPWLTVDSVLSMCDAARSDAWSSTNHSRL